jgi:hypothetical protein
LHGAGTMSHRTQVVWGKPSGRAQVFGGLGHGWFLFSLNNFALNCRPFKTTGPNSSFKRKLKQSEFRTAFILPQGENSDFF